MWNMYESFFGYSRCNIHARNYIQMCEECLDERLEEIDKLLFEDSTPNNLIPMEYWDDTFKFIERL